MCPGIDVIVEDMTVCCMFEGTYGRVPLPKIKANQVGHVSRHSDHNESSISQYV